MEPADPHPASQQIFQTVYRGRQSAFHHMAYMRMAKVLFTLRILARAGIRLEGKSLFDYGFGAGTFFRYCPAGTRLFGVETDAENVAQVRAMLARRGVEADLQPVSEADWKSHPLLRRQYDIVLCSHVLEHLPDPPDFLRAILACVKPGGCFLGLVPINERKPNPHHLHQVDRAVIGGWAVAAGGRVVYYEEQDPLPYWIQPWFAHDSGVFHKLAQAASLGLGVPATLLGPGLWFALSGAIGAATFSKPTQAGFVLGV